MERYYLTNEIAVDVGQAEELMTNGETGDAKIALHCAPDADDNQWLFYLETNGDPVLLCELGTAPYSPEEWIETLGVDLHAVAQAIAESPADEESTWWALETIGVDARQYMRGG